MLCSEESDSSTSVAHGQRTESRKKTQNPRERLSIYAHDCIYFNMRLPYRPANLSISCDSEMQFNFL